jgi:GntR family transcriptional repressor for pyruvate dehydrogenase complex
VAAKKGAPPRREKPQQIADDLRALIVSGQLADGDLLGHEPTLVERFGVSRPSLREALRILEAQGLISVVRGVSGGVFVRKPDERLTARTTALLLQARNVPLEDVFTARSHFEPLAARRLARSPGRAEAVADLGALVDEGEKSLADPEAFAKTSAAFHERLMELGGNQTLTIVSEMLNEIVTQAVATVSQAEDTTGSLKIRRRAVRSQRRLLEHIEAGDDQAAEAHWRSHMNIIGKVMLGTEANTVVDLVNHY